MNTYFTASYIKKYYHIIILILIILELNGCGGCGSRKKSIDAEIGNRMQDGQGISCEEWQELQKIIREDENLVKLRDIDSLKQKIQKIGAKKQLKSDIDDCSSKVNKTHFNLYLENSGSMFGYMEGKTNFKGALYKMCTSINTHDDSININFINDSILPIAGTTEEFIGYLEPQKLSKMRKVGTTKIAEIFDLVIDKVANEDKPAILISDFIFSLENKGEIQNQLQSQQYGITNIIHNAGIKKKGYGFLIIKGNSEFKGRYYDMNDPSKGRAIDLARPYYIWVIAKEKILLDFIEDYEVLSYPGYQNHAFIYSTDKMDIFYTILNETQRLGRFRKTNRNESIIKSIEDIEYSNRNEKVFQFSVAADFSKIKMDDAYLTDKKNFIVEMEGGDEMTIESITPIKQVEVKSSDKKLLASATHLIVLKSTKQIRTGKQKLQISLKKQLSKWIDESSTDDDTDIGKGNATQNKTFGFKYLVEGIYDEFKPDDKKQKDYFFTLDLELDR